MNACEYAELRDSLLLSEKSSMEAVEKRNDFLMAVRYGRPWVLRCAHCGFLICVFELRPDEGHVLRILDAARCPAHGHVGESTMTLRPEETER